jgi:predicted HTH transcriptional regulator
MMRKVENQNMEYKQAWNDNCLKTICAFANTDIVVADLKKWHLSRPRNELLADVFFKAGMIEAWGRGTVKIIDECKKAGLPEPDFKEEFGGLSVHFRKADKAQEAQVALQKWQQEVLMSCFYDEKTDKEIMEIAGYGSRTGNFKKGLQRLLDYQLLELTIPNKPNSRLQKYRLTGKGRRLVTGMRGDKRK